MEVYKGGKYNTVHVHDKIGGVNHRRTLSPGTDISNEPQEVQDVCNAAWTPEVIEAYEAHKEASV